MLLPHHRKLVMLSPSKNSNIFSVRTYYSISSVQSKLKRCSEQCYQVFSCTLLTERLGDWKGVRASLLIEAFTSHTSFRDFWKQGSYTSKTEIRNYFSIVCIGKNRIMPCTTWRTNIYWGGTVYIFGI